MLARLVIRRATLGLLAHASQCPHPQPRITYVRPQFAITTFKPTSWATRAYSTPGQDKDNQRQQESQTESNTEKEEEVKDKEEGETKEAKDKEEAKEEGKVDDTPIEEPGWKTARAGKFNTQKQGQKEESKISKELAMLYWILGLGGLTIGVYQAYKAVSHQYKEGQADRNSLFRKVLEQSLKSITENQKTIDAFFKTQSVPEEAMANCQVFGNTTTLSFPLLQMNTAARLGTVYVDLLREEDTYEIKSAYVDSVYGHTLDLIEKGIIKPEKYDLFDPEFSVQRLNELMQQAHDEMMRQQAQAEQAKLKAQAQALAQKK